MEPQEAGLQASVNQVSASNSNLPGHLAVDPQYSPGEFLLNLETNEFVHPSLFPQDGRYESSGGTTLGSAETNSWSVSSSSSSHILRDGHFERIGEMVLDTGPYGASRQCYSEIIS